MRNASYLFAASIAMVSAPAAAQQIQQGTYVNDDDSAKFEFGASSGSFIQYKSINGNPGTVTIEFDYSLSGNSLTMRQKRISLTGHPMARSQALDKTISEKIEVRPEAVVIGGVTYRRQ